MHVEWSWKVPASTQAMTWTLQVICGSKHAAVSMLVQGHGHGRGRSSSGFGSRVHVRVRQSGAAFSEPPIEAPTPTRGELAPALPASLMLPSGAVMFPLSAGQCTSWAYFKRPDIYDNRASTDPSTDWSADTWAGHALAEGLAVDGSPRVGDIAAWPQSFGPPGHLAYVEAVEAGGAIVISEMNTSGLPPEDYHQDPEGHTYETETIEEPTGLGLEYIH